MQTPLTPSFERVEYQNRIQRVRKAMSDRGLDFLVCHNLSNICYLTGFQTIGSYGYGHQAAVISQRSDVVLFASDFEAHNATLHAYVDHVETYSVLPGHCLPVDAFAECLGNIGANKGRVGYEPGHYSLTIEEWHRLRGKMTGATFVEAVELVDEIKKVKSKAEITVMRRAGQLTSIGLLAGQRAIAEGKSDNEVAAAMYHAVIGAGGDYFSLQPVVTAGKRSGIPHSTFSQQKLQNGDAVFVELAACAHRYAAPALRTFHLGPPSLDIQRAATACRSSVEAMLNGLKPGRAARDVTREAGSALRAIESTLVWHGYFGYSVGLTFPPMCSDCVSDVAITESSPLILEAGMVFHCNTSLRKIGQFGVTCGETVLITEDGCEVLTPFPRELVVC